MKYDRVHAHEGKKRHLGPIERIMVIKLGFRNQQRQAASHHQHKADTLPRSELFDDIGDRHPCHRPTEQPQIRHSNHPAEQAHAGEMAGHDHRIGELRLAQRGGETRPLNPLKDFQNRHSSRPKQNHPKQSR